MSLISGKLLLSKCYAKLPKLKNSLKIVSRFLNFSFKKKDFFILGIARGATPCLKIIVLVPLLIVSGLAFSFVLLIVFAISSSVYPIIGFLGTSLLDGFNKYSRHLKVIGAILIIVLGFYVPANHIWNLGGKI